MRSTSSNICRSLPQKLPIEYICLCFALIHISAFRMPCNLYFFVISTLDYIWIPWKLSASSLVLYVEKVLSDRRNA